MSFDLRKATGTQLLQMHGKGIISLFAKPIAEVQQTMHKA